MDRAVYWRSPKMQCGTNVDADVQRDEPQIESEPDADVNAAVGDEAERLDARQADNAPAAKEMTQRPRPVHTLGVTAKYDSPRSDTTPMSHAIPRRGADENCDGAVKAR
ncbi:hypothetical protein B0I35DRAFT_485208 [Stachybotrys elegans]|uniref:Uncharacterized protein n=1 Tax=Stachybotrys elegans TaxID=80388 RepID=A0A8K0SCZ2_9HYPO|nr:hypothetical protein B0I35DRAFT_485208 [Stachybotrys elegans]